MKVLIQVGLVLSICLFVSCARNESAGEIGDPAGIWVGDFGPAFYDRNTISLELHWDGKDLTGMIRPGVQGGRMYRNFEGFPIENGSFDPPATNPRRTRSRLMCKRSHSLGTRRK